MNNHTEYLSPTEEAHLAERLSVFYQANSASKSELHVIWNTISQLYHNRLTSVLLTGNTNDIIRELSSGSTTKITAGVANALGLPTNDPWYQNAICWIAEKLHLTHALNPEQPDCTRDAIQSRKLVEEWLGGTLGGLAVPFGSNDGVQHEAIWCLAGLVSIYQWLGKWPQQVLECGGGYGVFGYLATCRKECEGYTSIDTPVMCVMAAWCQSHFRGLSNIWMEDESGSALMRFCPVNALQSVYDRSYDVVTFFNCFPEFPVTVQINYLNLVAKTLKPGGILFSVNHESTCGGQRSLWDAVQETNLFRCASRHPFVLRPGWLEEVYVLR